MSDKRETLRAMSKEIDSLYRVGKKKEGKTLLRKALDESQSVPAYHLFFQGEYEGYVNKDLKAAQALFEKAVALDATDFFLLRNLGVSLSKQGKEEEAMSWYDKALAANPEDFAAMREMGVSLSRQGKEEEAMSWYDKALAANPEDFAAMRGMGVSLSCLGKMTEAMVWYDKALAANPQDSAAMRNMGVSLSKQGKEAEAMVWYDKALAANPQDSDAMRQLGVSLSYLGRMSEAMSWFDKALATNPQDYDAMRQMGVLLSEQGRAAEAMSWFDKALAANPDDALCYRELAVAKFKVGDIAGALEMIKKALTLKPDDKDYQGVLQFIASSIGMDSAAVLDDVTPPIDLEQPGIDALRGLVRQTREKIQPRIDDYKAKMKAAEDRLRKFLGKESNIQPDRSLLLTLRKWNSYTPTIPSGNDERYVGGGYVLYHNGKAVVIDPGHNFIENFDQAGGRVCDIDAIVMTHAHSDHTNDFESLLTLLYEYNDQHHLKAGMADYKQVDVYLNVGAMKKFSGLVDLRGSDYIRNVVVMSPQTEYVLANGIRLCPLPAYHDELVTKKYAVGLHLRVPLADGKSRTLLFTADTGLFPQTKKKVDGGKEKTVADVDGKEIHELYCDCVKDVDVLIPHLGSIKPEEIEAEIDTRWDEIFYPNHLGILGTIRLITSVSPRLVFVSEFGEELRGFRSELMTIMQEVVTKFRAGKGHDIRVLPADTPLIYDLQTDEIYCILSEDFCSGQKMRFKEVGDSFYYYSEGAEDKLDKIKGRSKQFALCLENRDKLYFKN